MGNNSKVKVGLLGVGLNTYWGQFEGLLSRLQNLQNEIGKTVDWFACRSDRRWFDRFAGKGFFCFSKTAIRECGNSICFYLDIRFVFHCSARCQGFEKNGYIIEYSTGISN